MAGILWGGHEDGPALALHSLAQPLIEAHNATLTSSACAPCHAGSNLSLPDLADGPNAIALVWKHLTVKSKAGNGKVSMS